MKPTAVVHRKKPAPKHRTEKKLKLDNSGLIKYQAGGGTTPVTTAYPEGPSATPRTLNRNVQTIKTQNTKERATPMPKTRGHDSTLFTVAGPITKGSLPGGGDAIHRYKSSPCSTSGLQYAQSRKYICEGKAMVATRASNTPFVEAHVHISREQYGVGQHLVANN